MQQGIEFAEETGSKLSLARLYFTAGQLFLNNHVNKDIVLEYLLEAENLFAELNSSEYLNWVKLTIGDAHFRTGNDSLAMDFYQEVSSRLHPSNYSTISSTDHKIGMVYKSRKEFDSALLYLQKSIEGMCVACPEILIHNTMIEAGRLCLIVDNAPQALVYLNNAYKLAKELGLLRRVKTTAEALSEIHYSKRAFQASADYLEISNQMNDSLAAIEKYNEIAKLEMRFEIEKREEERRLETELLQSEISKQKLIRNAFIGGAILLIIIGIVILRAYRSKRKDNRLLSKQKTEIQEISEQLQEAAGIGSIRIRTDRFLSGYCYFIRGILLPK